MFETLSLFHHLISDMATQLPKWVSCQHLKLSQTIWIQPLLTAFYFLWPVFQDTCSHQDTKLFWETSVEVPQMTVRENYGSSWSGLPKLGMWMSLIYGHWLWQAVVSLHHHIIFSEELFGSCKGCASLQVVVVASLFGYHIRFWVLLFIIVYGTWKPFQKYGRGYYWDMGAWHVGYKGQSALTLPVASQLVQLLNENLKAIDLPLLWKKQ